MPLIYGEGSRAFTRLQEEIPQCRYDLTILAWQTCDKRALIFAHSPSDFDYGMYLYPPTSLSVSKLEVGPSLSAKGLSVNLELLPIRQYVYLAIVAVITRDFDPDFGKSSQYFTLGMMLLEMSGGGYARLHDEKGKCLFVSPASEMWAVSTTHDHTRLLSYY